MQLSHAEPSALLGNCKNSVSILCIPKSKTLPLCCLDAGTIRENTELIGHQLEQLQAETLTGRELSHAASSRNILCYWRSFPTLFPAFLVSLLQTAAYSSAQEFQDMADL